MADTSDALTRLLSDDIGAHANRYALADPSAFRRQHSYFEEPSELLRRYEAPLRSIFAALNQADRGAVGAMLSHFEWMTFLKTARVVGVSTARERPRHAHAARPCAVRVARSMQHVHLT